MKRNNSKKFKEDGYAILFTVMIVAIISMITMGLSNAAYKQIILSSVAKDSTTAFYQSDIASECALYLDNQYNMVPPSGTGSPWTCGGYQLIYSNPSPGVYSLGPVNESDSGKCFRVDVTKTNTGSAIATEVLARGYNICDKSNIRTVERAVQIDY